VVRIGQDVAVAVDGGLDGGVAELGGNEFEVFVLGDKEGRVGVAKIMKANFA
jgi:hypothetical protein